MSKTSDGIPNSKRHTDLSNNKDFKGLINQCRVCLLAGDIPIFGEINISADVSEFGGVKVSENDKLPQYICEGCHALLESAKLFRSSARKSFQILCKVVNFLQNNTDYELSKTVKVEYAPLDSTFYTSNFNNGTDNISLKNVEICAEADRSCSEDDINIKGEYLEFEDTTSGETSNANRLLVDFALQNNTLNSEFHVNTPANEEGDDEDMIMIIVSEEENDGNNSSHKICIKSEEITDIRYNQVTCEVCQDVVTNKYYEEHMKIHREKYMEKAQKQASRKMECKICNKVVTSSYYKFHMKMHGSDIDQATRLRKCYLCDKSFNAKYFNEHLKRVHSMQKKVTNEEDHEASLSKDTKIMQCPICDKNVMEPLYKIHLEEHGKQPKKYICDKCGMITNNSCTFKTHYLTHGGELKYKCQFCPYRGLHLGLLRVHVRTHTGEYNYKCTECSSRFLTKSNLGQHMRVHRLPVDFKCKACDKCFHTERSMDKHYKNTHLKLKTHVCETCGKGFGHRDTMLSHQLKAHNRKRFVTRGRLPSYLRPEHNNKQTPDEQTNSLIW